MAFSLSDFISAENIKQVGGTAADIIAATKKPISDQIKGANAASPTAVAKTPAAGYSAAQPMTWLKWAGLALAVTLVVGALAWLVKKLD